MSRENLPWLVLAILLLVGGWFASRHMLVVLPSDGETIETFREWLWGTRSIDLAVQVGIIFVGALGIAALLPRGDEGPRLEEVRSDGASSSADGMLLECGGSSGDEPSGDEPREESE